MSWPMACPSMPYLSACGLAVPGGMHRGFNAGGRLTYFCPRWEDVNAEVEVDSEPLYATGDDAFVYAYLNGVFKERVPPGPIYVAPPHTPSEIYLDAVVMPAPETWSNFQGINGSGVSVDLKLTWLGDSSTEEFGVYHGILADHTDEILVAVKVRKEDITIVNDTGNVAEIDVLGFDGYHGQNGEYTIVVTETSGVITATITDDVSSDVFGPYTWDGLPIPFGGGLSLDLGDSWPVAGSTTFSVDTSILKEYVLKRPTDATHYFRVNAIRGDNDQRSSGYVSHTVDNPPGPVTDIEVAFIGTGAADITFTMPADADAAGWRLYLTRDWDDGYLIPHWMPYADGAAAHDADVTVHLTGLTSDTEYGFYIRSFDSGDNDDETTNVHYFTITSTGVLTETLQPPDWISAYASDKDTATIQVSVPDDAGETRVNIYSDAAAPGTINYSTVVSYALAAAKDESGVYTFSVSSLSTRNYQFAARCQNAVGVERNTHIVTSVYVFSEPVVAPSGLTVEEVPNG